MVFICGRLRNLRPIGCGSATLFTSWFINFGNRVRCVTIAGLATDTAGNTYFTLQSQSQVFRLAPDGRVTPYAGNGVHGKNGEDVLAINTPLLGPANLTVDSAGNLYIASGNGLLRVAPDGVLSTVLKPHYHPAGSANSILSVNGIAAGPDGVLYLCDGGDQRL